MGSINEDVDLYELRVDEKGLDGQQPYECHVCEGAAARYQRVATGVSSKSTHTRRLASASDKLAI